LTHDQLPSNGQDSRLRETDRYEEKFLTGLCGLAEHVLLQDPLSGHLFVFRNRIRDRLKVMYWDGDGLAILV